MRLLKQIEKPEDVKKLKMDDLNLLAAEIREFIIENVSQTGGHLAPNLGVVEMTLALHYIFDTTTDRIVWDVGHQSYVHKIITGRKDSFATLRQFGGLAGFPKREESIHDAFNTGHSSTSISAALGFALARDRKKENYQVAAIIGDGALTGGQAFEALNETGHLGVDMTVILNDNEMSIAENVGAMSSYLSRLRSDPSYTKRKKDIELLLRKVPAIGTTVVKAAERVKDSLKYLVVPGMLFEEMGFTYLGPIDGHNIRDLIAVLKQAKEMEGPVLLHILTKKGKGYKPAEYDPSLFHGVGPFNLESGEVIKKSGPPTYTKVFSKALVDLAEKDERIAAITAAMPEGTGLNNFAARYPERFFDVGIAEQNAVTMATSMALAGMRPVVAIYSTFLQRAYDQIIHDVCLQKAPVLFAIDRAGIVGHDGPTHHGAFDLSYLRHIPNMAILAPKDEEELRHMLSTALQYQGPVALRYPRGQGVGVPLSQEYQTIPWGKGETLVTGKDLVIIAGGTMVYPALETGKILDKQGISTTVINARFIKPLDEELIKAAVEKHKYVVTMEENVIAGGFGAGVLELLARLGLAKKVLNIGLPDAFVTQGNTSTIHESLNLTAEKMNQRIRDYFNFS